ncbi:MAG: phosphoglucosamine mutase [Ruminococcaceae bacterium]|nr:phosphoglucosamine mutase [Oscillospiraceae bacterium]
MGRLFGTDGVRGIANKELTPSLAFKIGQAGALVLTKHTNSAHPKILVGKDTRVSGDMLECALVAGFCSVGAHAVCVGKIPTPAVAYLVRKYKMDAGVVISASHNSVEYNGIKYFSSEGYKLSDELENEIEEYILDGKEIGELPIGIELGKRNFLETALRDYADFAKSCASQKYDGLKIALDCANGASYECAKLVFKELGAQTVLINNIPNGFNINENCGSTHIEGLQKFVVENKCDMGFAFDGDADRCLAVDENGNLVDGDKILVICAQGLKEEGKLKNNTVVATVMSNLGFFKALDKLGINYEQTKVGDRYVLQNMLENGHVIGGEQSGHVILLDNNTTGDGIVTALSVADNVVKSGKKLSELASCVNILPQVLENVKIKNEYKTTYMNDEVIASEIKKLEEKMAGNGRVLIRPSGTEPLVRVMIEGENLDEIQKDAKNLADIIAQRLS